MTCIPSLYPSGLSLGMHPPLWLRCILCVPKASCAGVQPCPWLGTPGMGANMVLILRCREPPNHTCCSPRGSCPFHEGHSRPGALTGAPRHDSRKQGPPLLWAHTQPDFCLLPVLPKLAPKISDSFTSYHNPSFSTRSRSLAGTEPARSGREALAPDTGEKELVGKASKLRLGTIKSTVAWRILDLPQHLPCDLGDGRPEGPTSGEGPPTSTCSLPRYFLTCSAALSEAGLPGGAFLAWDWLPLPSAGGSLEGA
ncbi:hypothetical protein mRhiFer1_009548 [Rhinolophus ferrumequinum]|uniref:Uncharacterized protein n=1 Tax=Rhinolophus ferrumequinum TaxID=59479 RepID=A0A7J7R8P7_RHIFE|nr:hypothetical protein mRhiFer1_009548 [Rhinolophus ferrumequinum]